MSPECSINKGGGMIKSLIAVLMTLALLVLAGCVQGQIGTSTPTENTTEQLQPTNTTGLDSAGIAKRGIPPGN
jgi:PBP1b-binding outer membrane lipoprotein LpoB